jgi:hypothetical protein
MLSIVSTSTVAKSLMFAELAMTELEIVCESGLYKVAVPGPDPTARLKS